MAAPVLAVLRARRSAARGGEISGVTTTYTPAAVNFTGANKLYQGATFDQVVNLTVGGSPLNLSAYAGTPPRCHMRKAIADAAPYITPVCSWIDASIGSLRVRIEAATLAALADRQDVSGGVHDIEVVNGADVLRVAVGGWEMSAEVTR